MIARVVEMRSNVGRPRKTVMRAVWDAIQYIATTGFQWRMLPKDFPCVSTVRYYFYRMRDDGTFTIINELLSVASRIVSGREDDPTAAVIDNQSFKTAKNGGVSGYDVGKMVTGRERHISFDLQGNYLAAARCTVRVFRTGTRPKICLLIRLPAFQRSTRSSLMAAMRVTRLSVRC